jgi:hypothetical protein
MSHCTVHRIIPPTELKVHVNIKLQYPKYLGHPYVASIAHWL